MTPRSPFRPTALDVAIVVALAVLTWLAARAAVEGVVP